MDKQDVDFMLVYMPGKDDDDPMDYLSRHPLPITGTDNTEKVVKRILTAEHAVELDSTRKENAKDKQLQKLYKRIVKED